jgi:hypothetical protein
MSREVKLVGSMDQLWNELAFEDIEGTEESAATEDLLSCTPSVDLDGISGETDMFCREEAVEAMEDNTGIAKGSPRLG